MERDSNYEYQYDKMENKEQDNSKKNLLDTNKNNLCFECGNFFSTCCFLLCSLSIS